MTTTVDIAIPDFADDAPALTVVDEHAVVVTISIDQDPSDPTEDGTGEGRIHSFSPCHRSFVGPKERLDALLAEHGEDVVYLSYFEHSRCWWGVRGEPTPIGVEFTWDGVRTAGIWVPDEDVLRDREVAHLPKGDPARVAALREAAGRMCEIWTAYSNGDAYEYAVAVYPLLRDADGEPLTDPEDYDGEEPVAQTDCSGYNDLTYCRERAAEAARAELAAIERP
jgi:hypothetical protein